MVGEAHLHAHGLLELEAALRAQRLATATAGNYDLGSSSLPYSNQTFCMLNRQRELTLLRSTATPTATSSASI